jgi:tight adherence protein C
MNFILYIAVTVTVFLVVALLMAPTMLRPSPAAQRILNMAQSARMDTRRVGNKEHVQERILQAAKALRARLGLADDEKLRQRFICAGMRNAESMDLYFAVRFACPIAGIVGGSFIKHNTLFWVFALAIVGYLLPDMWLTRQVKKRRARIRKGIPDALDLLVICVDAGLGLDQAILRVGQELDLSHPDINLEFMQINLEQRAGKPRLEAWKDTAERTNVEEFTSFVTMLAQADKFGTPIIRALSRFADDLRIKRRQRAEEQAAKTKVKIIFPLVLFIFPCLFIVLLAPALLNISKSLSMVN